MHSDSDLKRSFRIKSDIRATAVRNLSSAMVDETSRKDSKPLVDLSCNVKKDVKVSCPEEGSNSVGQGGKARIALSLPHTADGIDVRDVGISKLGNIEARWGGIKRMDVPQRMTEHGNGFWEGSCLDGRWKENLTRYAE